MCMRAKDQDDFLERIANDPRYGLPAKAVLQQMLEDPRYRDSILIIPAGAQGYDTDENRRFFDILYRRAPANLLAGTLKKATRAMGSVLDLKPIEPGQPADRAPTNEPGLVNSALAFIGACRSHESITQALEIHTDRMTVLVAKVWIGQQVETVVNSFHTLLTGNLGVWESALLVDLRNAFNVLDPVSGRNPDLAEELGPPRRYLRGPAAVGAQTRRDNKRNLETLTSKATTAGMAEAEKKVSSSIKDRIGQALGAVIPGFSNDTDPQDSDSPQKAAASRRRRER